MASILRGLGVVAGLSAAYVGVAQTAGDRATLVALIAGQAVPAVLLARTAMSRPPGEGRPWWYAAASSASSALLFVVWLGYDLRGQVVPAPSVADIPYLVSVVLLVPAVLTLPQVETGRGQRARLGLDGAIVATSVLIVSWHLLLGRAVESMAAPTLAGVALTAYPFGDVAAVTAALIVAVRAQPGARRQVALFALGVMSLAAGDTAYGLLSVAGQWHPGHPSTLLWFVAYPLMVVSARTHHRAAPTSVPESAAATRLRVLLLLGPVLGAVTLTLVHDAQHFSVAALAALFLLVLLRQAALVQGELRARGLLESRVREQTEELRAQVFRDTVTGLGNRALLRDRARAHREQAPSALLLLDLDGFKEVNDTLGHAAGDWVLLRVGSRLGEITREHDTVVRMGGDEFALLLPATGRRAALSTAERVLESLRAPVDLGQTTVQVRASVGIALAHGPEDVDELLRQADLAMYEAKGDGGDSVRVFTTDMHARLTDRLRMESEVRAALDRGEFVVYYQPVVSAATREVTGLEALVRWEHPERGIVPPFEFLGAAERTGAIVDLGSFVLRAACEQLAQWRQDWPELTVAVNLAHRELMDPGLAQRVAAVLADTGLPGPALHLEITETVLISHEEIRAALAGLVEIGVGLSIDDFGTGHSSLARIRDLPVDRLKIDRSFVKEINEGAAPLLGSVVALGHSLGLRIVAEGVETQDQLDFLLDRGCDEVQGYLFSRPVPAAHVIPLLFSIRSEPRMLAEADRTVLPELMSALADPARDLDGAIRELLRELSEISGLESTFVTTVHNDIQVTHHAHNSGELTIPVGLTVDWSDTLCRRLVDDDVEQASGVTEHYRDAMAAHELGIETYVSIPIEDGDGTLVGTLCGASGERKQVDASALSLMRLFARVLAERIGAFRRQN